MVIIFVYSLFVFFFKQKTAYEMRISDWSSDVCSSDLVREAGWAGFIEAFIFIFILGASLVYLWKIGALDWGPAARSRPPRDRQTERSPAVERTTGSSR